MTSAPHGAASRETSIPASVISFIRGAEWAAQRYTATGESGFYEIARAAAQGKAMPPTPSTPAVTPLAERLWEILNDPREPRQLCLIERDELAAAIAAIERHAADSARLDFIEDQIHGTGKALSIVSQATPAPIADGRKRVGEGDDLRDALDYWRKSLAPTHPAPESVGGDSNG